MRFTKATFILWSALCLSTGQAPATTAPALSATLLSDNWKIISWYIDQSHASGIDLCLQEVQLRFIAAHSFLATGQNDRATQLFYCTEEGYEKDAQTWEAWVAAELISIPNSCVLRFFHADALARLGRYGEASQVLHNVTTICPNQIRYMAYNSLGIIEWITNKSRETGDAAQFLRKACRDNLSCQENNFSDAELNIGLLYLSTGKSLKAAGEYIDKAYNKDKNNSIAILGRASIALANGVDRYKIASAIEKEANRKIHLVNSSLATLAGSGKEVIDKSDGSRGFATAGTAGIIPGAIAGAISGALGGAIAGATKEFVLGGIRGGISTSAARSNSTVEGHAIDLSITTWFILNYPEVKHENQ